jgi:hypothetical protein
VEEKRGDGRERWMEQIVGKRLGEPKRFQVRKEKV